MELMEQKELMELMELKELKELMELTELMELMEQELLLGGLLICWSPVSSPQRFVCLFILINYCRLLPW